MPPDTEEYVRRTELLLESACAIKAAYERTNSQKFYELYSDLKQAIEEADLSELQRERIYMYYLSGYSQDELAQLSNSSQPAVSKSLRFALEKIAEVFEEWKYWTEGEAYVPRLY